MSKSSKPTSLGYAILGLLKDGPLTGYRIRMIFETTAMGNYSSSPGSIYPALKRLRKLGLVTKIAEKDKGKAHFTLSQAGREALLNWMRKDITIEDINKRMSELMLRFAFQDGMLDPKGQKQFIHQMITQLRSVIKGMEAFFESNGAHMPLHGRLAFESGLQSYRSFLKWARYASEEIEKHAKSIS